VSHAAKLAKLKLEVETGTYTVAPGEIAEAMLRRWDRAQRINVSPEGYERQREAIARSWVDRKRRLRESAAAEF
jgi:hypothetical protein